MKLGILGHAVVQFDRGGRDCIGGRRSVAERKDVELPMVELHRLWVVVQERGAGLHADAQAKANENDRHRSKTQRGRRGVDVRSGHRLGSQGLGKRSALQPSQPRVLRLEGAGQLGKRIATGTGQPRELRFAPPHRKLRPLETMANMNISRRGFLKASALTGLGASIVGIANAGSGRSSEPASSSGRGAALPDLGSIPPRAGDQSPVHALTTKPIERVRAAIIGLHRGLEHVNDCLAIEFAEVVAVCDLRDDRAQAAAGACEKQRGRRPAVYSGSEDIWEKMVDRDDVDVVYIATPWAWHVPMCLRAMERG